MTKCSHADRYLAKRAPRCGCDTCRLKWLETQVAYLVAREQSRATAEQEERECWL